MLAQHHLLLGHHLRGAVDIQSYGTSKSALFHMLSRRRTLYELYESCAVETLTTKTDFSWTSSTATTSAVMVGRLPLAIAIAARTPTGNSSMLFRQWRSARRVDKFKFVFKPFQGATVPCSACTVIKRRKKWRP